MHIRHGIKEINIASRFTKFKFIYRPRHNSKTYHAHHALSMRLSKHIDLQAAPVLRGGLAYFSFFNSVLLC
jgi:hypothetical protein